MWEFSNKQEGETRKLNLLTRQRQRDENESIPKGNRKAFYHGGGVADELVSLSSLFLRRRFTIGPLVRMDNRPMYYEKDKFFINKALIKDTSNLSEISDWLERIKNLNTNFHPKYILSAKMYSRALQIIEVQPDLAYLNLVSAIEVICQDTQIEVTLEDVDVKINRLVKTIENEELKKELERSLLNKERFIGKRFVQFILNHIEDDFWEYTDRPELGRIQPEQLPLLLKNIYGQRSNTLHNGTPFPPYIFDRSYENSEILFALGIQVGEKLWEPQDYIPYPHFFERLVNYVLKKFLLKNS